MSSTLTPRLIVLTSILFITLGCLTTASRNARPLFEQGGEFTIAAEADKEIIFPIPFAKAPEVKLKDDWIDVTKVIECKPDRMKIHNTGLQVVHATWIAKGERADTATEPPAAAPATPRPLPKEPTPIP